MIRTDAIIIGGGLGGGAMAYALGKRKIKTFLIEKNEMIASGASGQVLGLAAPVLHKVLTPKMALVLLGLKYLHLHIQDFEACLGKLNKGILTLAHRPHEWERFCCAKKISFSNELNFFLCKAEETKEYCGLACRYGGAFFPDALRVPIAKLTQAYIQCSKTKVKTLSKVQNIKYLHKNRLWHIYIEKEGFLISAPHLILCNSFGIKEMTYDENMMIEMGNRQDDIEENKKELPKRSYNKYSFDKIKNKIRSVRGQSFIMRENELLSKLTCALSYDGYIIPKYNERGDCVVGATFEEWNQNSEIDSLQNTKMYHRFLELFEYEETPSIAPSILSTRVAFRSTTSDRLPFIGQMDENLWMSTAFGSNGLAFAPIGAEYIASKIMKESRFLGIHEEFLSHADPLR